MNDEIVRRFRDVAPAGVFWSLRVVEERHEILSVARGVVQPPHVSESLGVMVTVIDGAGAGYGATPDLGRDGLARAASRAREWARRAAALGLFDASSIPREPRTAEHAASERIPWGSVPAREKIDRLRALEERLRPDSRIVDGSAALWRSEIETTIVDVAGTRLRQRFACVLPTMSVTASAGGVTETRTFGGHAWARQGGFEVVDEVGTEAAAAVLASEALELLAAPMCPTGVTDLVLAPDQMMLQVHESVGHPLELDRILGDERNYAGRSFVTPDMFGRYRYGASLMNVSCDPTVPGELASFAFDDEGTPAVREALIRDGLLVRPLGGITSQTRTGLPGVACARASGWNRPPVDRMANVNLEPGTSPFEAIVGAVERGVWMETNCSWSIDDSRNKFQFGCERGRRIVDGELREVVRRPGYRGTTRDFWHRLAAVGDRSTFRVLGTPYCGKGEPNQAIRAGHAAPVCLFRGIDVFGGEG